MQTVFQFLKSLGPAIPLSIESKDGNGALKPMSNSELRRCIEQKSVVFNGEGCDPNEVLDFPITSVVFFPKSEKRKTTLW